LVKSKVSCTGTVDTDYDFNRDFLLKDYQGWLQTIVHSVLRKFSKNNRWDFDELMGEAYLALCESAQKFNPEYSHSLLGYAKPYIYKRIHEFISVNMYTFKVRYYNIRHDQDKVDTVNRMERELWSDHKGNEESPRAHYSPNMDTFFDTPLTNHPSGHKAVEEQVELAENTAILKQLVNTELASKERRALVRRHRHDESFQQIGDKLGVSKESARRIYQRGLEKLRFKATEAGIND